MATHNARQTDRAPFFAEIDLLAAGAPVPRRLWGGDVSEAGMFVQTTHPFHVGDRVALRFDVDDHEVHVRAAEVMWVRRFEPISVDGKLPGIGLRFVTLDPPARAALRRLARKAVGEHRPGDTTLPDRESQILPSETPRAALSSTHGAAAGAGAARPERAEELPAISMAPFTELPRVEGLMTAVRGPLTPPLMTAPTERFSLPPDEPALDAAERVFQTPAAVTIGPKRTSAPPTPPPATSAREPFAGWTFRALDADAEAAPPSAPPEHLGLAFDDERPGSLLEVAPDDDSGPRELRLPALARDDEPEPSLLGVAHDDVGALSGKPVAAERRRLSQRRPVRALPLAAALLCSGALVGVGVGVISKRIEHVPTPAAAVLASPAPAVDAAAPVAPVIDASAPTSEGASSGSARVLEVAAAERTLTPVDVVAGALPAPRAVVPNAPRAPAPVPSTPAPRNLHSDARVEVAVGNARVLKTFTLTGPHRVVVDLAEATLPGKATPTSEPGVTRVRFGAPAPGTARVVVETAEAARKASARVIDGRLIISFAS
ncbi:MAG: AMIN domain-containing protein [Deltaproteobacteria bacterium]|nr:AMIN domain-containing protein [Deltaproteobacteria bacterium]